MRYAMLRPLYASPFWRMTLPGTAGETPDWPATDLWPGDATRGEVIVGGDFQCAGKIIRNADAPWSASGVSENWIAAVAGFDWLRDLRAVGSEAARERARVLVRRWIETYGEEWNALAWRPELIGERIANWLGQGEFLTAGADEEFIVAFSTSLRRQYVHLRRTLKYAGAGAPRIGAIKGLLLASLALDGGKMAPRALRMLETEIAAGVLGDGGHLSRNPAAQLSILRELIDIRAALREAQREIPEAVQTAIDRMAPTLRFFRHGDGGLALFNGADEDEGWLIDVVLSRSEARGKPHESAPHSGFERLTADRTLVLADVGAPPPRGFDLDAHAGTLSFEMSVGKERIVVNCGAHHGSSEDWQLAQRTTAAHSTVTVEDSNSAELLPGGGIGARPQSVTVERRDADGNIWLNAAHDGYRRAFGITHRRRLYLGERR
jgi:uncharacterized heparinase superfamily protein